MASNVYAPYVECDGGRAAVGHKGYTGDCVVRALSIFQARHWAPSRMADTYRVALGESMALVIATAEQGDRLPTKPGQHPGVSNYLIDPLFTKWGLRSVSLEGVRLTVGTFACIVPDCIVGTLGHVTAVVGGRVHDAFDSRRRRVTSCWVAVGDQQTALRAIRRVKASRK